MSSKLIVEPDFDESNDSNQSDPRKQLVNWVMRKVDDWRQIRESTFRETWDDYYRIWRGRYDPKSKSRRTERSRLISPASQIAVDNAVSEIIEAVFSREVLFDITDDLSDQEREDALVLRDLLVEELYKDGIIEALQEIVLNGALYGQFIAKIVVDIQEKATAQVVQNPETGAQELKKIIQESVRVFPVPVEPGQLVVDPTATNIDDMLGAAQECEVPVHSIKAKQANGVYFDDVVVGAVSEVMSTDDRNDTDTGTLKPASSQGMAAVVVEWHGLVPAKLLAAVNAEGDDLAEAISSGAGDDEMVEAIVTIANKTTLLRAIANPSIMEDRAIVAEQFDTVSNRFWGRSVMEKGWNIQKALDSELRARADSLAWINNPMIAGDITKLPPNMNKNAWPGKFWGTKGNPAEALQEFRFADINASTFQQSNDYERMHQNATGAIDPSVLNAGVRDQATGASAINVSGIVKRNKRTMLNLEAFLTNLIRRIAWRKMQFNPQKYPRDFQFAVTGTIGMMARSVEQQQLVQMLQFVDKGTPEYFGILAMIVEGSQGARKSSLMRLVQAAAQPPSQEEVQKAQAKQEQMEQLQMQQAVEQLRNVQADTALKLKTGGVKEAEALLKRIEAEMIDDQLQLETVRAQVDIKQAVNQERQIETGERKQALEEAKFQQGE
jgi:hypothetical protein